MADLVTKNAAMNAVPGMMTIVLCAQMRTCISPPIVRPLADIGAILIFKIFTSLFAFPQGKVFY